ncbi:MAG TPA: response regulator, partial [Acidimicrobiales bacterium]|nr:response regulator [Acidimicrobiales bacterium]
MSEVALARDDEDRAKERVRILVVEDEESYREALQAGLTKEGYDIELAEDGPGGLASFAAHPPDLVL